MTVKVDSQGRLKRSVDSFEFKAEMLGDRAERARLPKRRDGAYWAPLGSAGGTQVFIGYSNRLPEGEWHCRWIDSNGRSNWTSIALADDRNVKGGISLSAARAKAEQWARAQVAKRR